MRELYPICVAALHLNVCADEVFSSEINRSDSP
jgi:hypothetical protein